MNTAPEYAQLKMLLDHAENQKLKVMSHLSAASSKRENKRRVLEVYRSLLDKTDLGNHLSFGNLIESIENETTAIGELSAEIRDLEQQASDVTVRIDLISRKITECRSALWRKDERRELENLLDLSISRRR